MSALFSAHHSGTDSLGGIFCDFVLAIRLSICHCDNVLKKTQLTSLLFDKQCELPHSNPSTEEEERRGVVEHFASISQKLYLDSSL